MALGLQSVADMMRFPSSLSLISLLLSLLLLVPRVGLAAQEAPTLASEGSTPEEALLPKSSGLPGTEERAPLRLSEDSWAPEPEHQRPSRALRILAELGAGLLTTGAGVVGGALAGAGLCEAGVVGSRGGWLPCLDAAAVGLLLGGGVGIPLGVFWGGEVAGGEGSLLGALAGMGSGAVAGFLLGALMFRDPSGGPVVSAPMALVGAIVGYELSDRGAAPAPRAQASPAVASARPRIQPVLAVSSRGALLGLGGTF
jgi:hypothetical protein